MRFHGVRPQRLFLLTFGLIVFVWLIASLSLGIPDALFGQTQVLAAAPLDSPGDTTILTDWTLSGRVFDGVPFNEDHPIPRVTVSVYGSNNPYPGSLAGAQYIRETTTDASGWWSLTVYDDDGAWEFYFLVETDLQNYTSIDATTIGGNKRTNNLIEYVVPLSGKTLTGNKFWDRGPATETPTATDTATPSTTASPTNTPSPSSTTMPSRTATQTQVPDTTATDTRQPEATPTDTRVPEATATNTATTSPSDTPRVTETPTPTPRETVTPTPTRPVGPGTVTFPQGDWPVYAQGEITVDPEPPMAGNLTKICCEVINTDPTNPAKATLEFRVAAFGIGIPFSTIDLVDVVVPPGGAARGCVIWTPPMPGHWCFEVIIHQEGAEPQWSQRNVDVDEPLVPGEGHARSFPVGNPLDHPATITLVTIPHLPGWQATLLQDTFPEMAPGDIREAVLMVTPPQGEPLPPDGQVIVDVEAWAGDVLIGGFRKFFRPPVPLHRFPDPSYAEREITIHPYPPRAGEPTEICVELRNPLAVPQDVMVQFEWAAFGIGIPFTPINGPIPVHLPPHSTIKQCIHWIPPVGGHACIQVILDVPGYAPQFSQRNMDVDEPLEPGIPHARTFPVGNPLDRIATIDLGLVPHVANWGFELSMDRLPDMAPGETRDVTLTVTPPQGEPLPPAGSPIVDVEAYVEGELIGGFRKVFYPPVPLHRPKDPVYTESEIGIDPYPVIPGQPVKLSVEVFNPTDHDEIVEATFSVAPFGIGLPFEEHGIQPNPVPIYVPAHGAARGHTEWTPRELAGKVCVQVMLQIEGHEPVYSRRNVDVGEPLRPGVPHALEFPVSIAPRTEPVTVTLGLVMHKPGWQASVSPRVLPNVREGQIIQCSLVVTPSHDAMLGTGEPIVDVEAYAEGELIGGFRKLDIPPIPLHKPHEKSYAESEIRVAPYPPKQGQETEVSAVLQNASSVAATVEVMFGWARFGMGIPFSTAGMDPITRTLNLPPMASTVATTTWTPVYSGHQCILVKLFDPEGDYQPQESQRNVDVTERPPCDVTKVFTFTVYNDSPFTATVDIGMITFNVPQDWQVTTNPTGSVEIEPYGEATIQVIVKIPCPSSLLAMRAARRITQIQQAAGSVPIIDVEGYIEGRPVGGIEIRLTAPIEGEGDLFLPLVFKESG